jgi:TetR/AcrR family transcriptional repressor of bet genes
MPKKVDHGLRRRQITDAVCRITLKGGLSLATFREVAAEAGVSVRLVQYYFGSKDGLLLATQQHVARRSIARLNAWIAETDGTPRAWLRAFLTSFIPIDEESRVAMLMYVALHTESLVNPALAREEALAVPRTMRSTIAAQLRRGKLVKGADPEMEATILTTVVPGVSQSVLDGMLSKEDAFAAIDYALGRVFRQ